jgi:hypothetical protein
VAWSGRLLPEVMVPSNPGRCDVAVPGAVAFANDHRRWFWLVKGSLRIDDRFRLKVIQEPQRPPGLPQGERLPSLDRARLAWSRGAAVARGSPFTGPPCNLAATWRSSARKSSRRSDGYMGCLVDDTPGPADAVAMVLQVLRDLGQGGPVKYRTAVVVDLLPGLLVDHQRDQSVRRRQVARGADVPWMCPLGDWSKRSVRCDTLAGMARCACCRSPNAHFGPPRVPDGLPAKVTVCGICTRHLGNSPADVKRRDQDHFEQWAQDAELLTEEYRDALAKRDEHIEQLRAAIGQLEQKLDERPVRVVHENLDQEAVDGAYRDRDRALVARDAAYRLVAQFRSSHHDTGRGTCKCGVIMAKCDVTKIIDSDRSFLRWEASQCALVGRNGRFSSKLPEGHPALINSRWSPSEPMS